MKKTFLLLLALCSMHTFQAQTTQSKKDGVERFNCYFEYNSAILPKDSVEKLNAWLKPYLQKSGLKMKLAAYTDTIGSIERNKILAQRRLDAVKKHLVKQNINIEESFAMGEFYDLESYSNDKAHRVVYISISFDEDIAAAGSGALKTIDERMEVFATAKVPVNLNIQFVPGEDVYIGDSYLDVAALFEYMRNNPDKKVFIRGHVCCENDVELSNRRAFAVYNDLVLEGIDASRVSYKGFGNSMPVTEEIDEYTRQMNRRVDVVFSDL